MYTYVGKHWHETLFINDLLCSGYVMNVSAWISMFVCAITSTGFKFLIKGPFRRVVMKIIQWSGWNKTRKKREIEKKGAKDRTRPNLTWPTSFLRGCRAFTSRQVDCRRRLVLAGLLPEAIRSRNGETALILKPILEEKSGIRRHSCESTMRRKSSKRRAALIARSFYLSPFGNKRFTSVGKLEHL